MVSALASQQERFAKAMNVRRIGKSKLSLSVSVCSLMWPSRDLLAADECRRKCSKLRCS